ncbi:MAG TPA: 16S rRNA (adenine(1518)-N(6)/adenine(1519)-N(6))-dimethyltransferase RsmA [Capsulimonadaceae bacterium]|jgi:16S rRNA (adenine1518-N6/adenine1519-N6)-dimethyltransferase
MSNPTNLSSPAAVNQILHRFKLSPQKRFGQNFLVDANILGRIVDSGGVGPGDQAFEIGAGLGVLTKALSERVGETGRVVTVEYDSRLLSVLEETLAGLPQTSVIPADVLSLDLAQTFRDNFDTDRPVSVIANIPYQITSPLIAALMEQKKVVSRLVFLVQKEVAQRLAAPPGSPEYGAFSVFCQYHATVEQLFTVPRTVFFPPPDVTSAVIRLTPRQKPAVDVADEAAFFAVVKAAFGQRRKTISNALGNSPDLGWSKDRVAAALFATGISPDRRGETLSLAEFAAIAAG